MAIAHQEISTSTTKPERHLRLVEKTEPAKEINHVKETLIKEGANVALQEMQQFPQNLRADYQEDKNQEIKGANPTIGVQVQESNQSKPETYDEKKTTHINTLLAGEVAKLGQTNMTFKEYAQHEQRLRKKLADEYDVQQMEKIEPLFYPLTDAETVAMDKAYTDELAKVTTMAEYSRLLKEFPQEHPRWTAFMGSMGVYALSQLAGPTGNGVLDAVLSRELPALIGGSLPDLIKKGEHSLPTRLKESAIGGVLALFLTEGANIISQGHDSGAEAGVAKNTLINGGDDAFMNLLNAGISSLRSKFAKSS